MRKTAIFLSMLLCMMLSRTALAEEQSSQAGMEKAQIMFDKVKADKKFITSQNMELTDAEAQAFWPVYDQFQEGVYKNNIRLAALVLTYAEAYKKKALTNELAHSLILDSISIEADYLDLKKEFLPKLEKVVPSIKAARYLQIENKLHSVVQLKLGEMIPLAE